MCDLPAQALAFSEWAHLCSGSRESAREANVSVNEYHEGLGFLSSPLLSGSPL